MEGKGKEGRKRREGRGGKRRKGGEGPTSKGRGEGERREGKGERREGKGLEGKGRFIFVVQTSNCCRPNVQPVSPKWSSLKKVIAVYP